MTLPDRVDRIVVGAGLCGLAAAHRAVGEGARTLLLEATSRVGGVLRTDRIGPWRVERAAAAFPSTATALLALVAALPDAPAIRRPPPETSGQLLWTGAGLRALPRSPPALLASPLLGGGAKVRLFAEFLRGPRRGGPPESLAGMVRRRLGAQIVDRLLRPMTLGIHGTSPETLGAGDAFPVLEALERDHGGILRGLVRRRGATKREIRVFEEGMEALPRAIAAALGADVVRTQTPVEGLGADGDGVAVTTRSRATVRARSVLLATTAPEQARLVAPFAPEASSLLAAVRYVPMVVASVGLSADTARRAPSAFGFLRGHGARGRILGAAFASGLNPDVAPPGHALWNVFLGGERDPDAVRLSDDDVRDVVERDLARVLGARVRLAFLAVTRWPRAIPVFAVGHRARMVRANALLAPHGVAVSGSHVTGVGVHACATAGS